MARHSMTAEAEIAQRPPLDPDVLDRIGDELEEALRAERAAGDAVRQADAQVAVAQATAAQARVLQDQAAATTNEKWDTIQRYLRTGSIDPEPVPDPTVPGDGGEDAAGGVE